jgi:hypothetical protein
MHDPIGMNEKIEFTFATGAIASFDLLGQLDQH